MKRDEIEKYVKALPKASEQEVKDAERLEEEMWFCNKEKMRENANRLIGNFTPVPGYACTYPYLKSFSMLRIINVRDLRPCDQGRGTIVEVTLSPLGPRE